MNCRRIRPLWTAGVAAALLYVPAAAQPQGWLQDLSGLQCRIELPKDRWLMEEPIRVRLTMTNTGRSPLRITHPAIECEGAIRWMIREARGEAVRRTQGYGGSGLPGRVPIQPGASRVWEFDVGRYYAIDSPGRYTVTATYWDFRPGGRTIEVPSNAAAFLVEKPTAEYDRSFSLRPRFSDGSPKAVRCWRVFTDTRGGETTVWCRFSVLTHRDRFLAMAPLASTGNPAHIRCAVGLQTGPIGEDVILYVMIPVVGSDHVFDCFRATFLDSAGRIRDDHFGRYRAQAGKEPGLEVSADGKTVTVVNADPIPGGPATRPAARDRWSEVPTTTRAATAPASQPAPRTIPRPAPTATRPSLDPPPVQKGPGGG